jgi:hypothetical protein
MSTLALIFGAQLVLALLGCALLLFEVWLARRGRAAAFGLTKKVRDRAFLALGVAGVAAYLHFGRLHGDGSFLHYWDTYHYYIGAKYFPELGYDRLYACTAVAEAEARNRDEVAARTMTDLHTNLQVPTTEILAHPERCKRHFTAARWAAFVHDVTWFRDRLTSWTWAKVQRDHGYNATPVWTVPGHLLANLAPASDGFILALALIDPLLLLAALLLLGRCFGLRVAAIAALTLGTYLPARFLWNGGAFLRFDWLFFLVAGLCALRKDRPLLGGMALGYAALLRLFPAALFVGPALALIEQLRVARTWRAWRGAPARALLGGALVAAVLVPLALARTGDWGATFLENTRKHAATPLTNHMGLPTVLAYRPATTAGALRPAAITDGDAQLVWPRFKEARRAALEQLRPALVVVGLLLLGALVMASRRLELWRVTALSLVLVPAFLQLTCYYYVFLIAWATLAERRPAIGAVLLGLCALLLELAFVVLSRLGTDETYVLLSAVTLIAMAAMLGMSLRAAPRPEDPPAREPSDAQT